VKTKVRAEAHRPRRQLDATRLPTMLGFADSLLRSEGAGLVALDGDFRFTFWNGGMERIAGLSADQVMGRRAIDVFPFLGEQEVHLVRALAGETVAAKRQRFTRAERDGFLDGYFTPFRDEKGNVVGVVCVIHDLTAQKLAEEQLGETERRFQNMADAAPVLLWMSEPDGLCTFFNQSWLDFTGRTLEDEWGVGWAAGIHFEDFQRCMDTYVMAFNARRVFEMEYRLRRHDGEYRWILDRGTPRYTPDGSFAGYIGSCIDITDRKRMEGELRKAVRDRDDFLSIASHELRTPLTTLSLEIQRLKRSLGKRSQGILKSGRLERGAEIAENQINRLIMLVEELLDVSRLASGRLRVEPAVFDLSDLVREVANRLQPSIDAAGCALSVEAPAPAVGSWDWLRVEQVIANLVSNALKYGPGKPIEMSVTRETECACLRVKDYGIGIAPQDQRRIFHRFERAVPMSHYRGFGLGLWIAREIVVAHGGSIDVDSELGRGSTFIVRLPLRAA
jgi:PAS domain S-box-containing protein